MNINGISVYLGGQAVAQKLGGQITKSSKKIKSSLGEYNQLPNVESSLPATLDFDEVSAPSSSIWQVTGKHVAETNNTRTVGLTAQDQARNFARMVARAEEESLYLTREMENLLHHYTQQATCAHSKFQEIYEQSDKDVEQRSTLSRLMCAGFWMESYASKLDTMLAKHTMSLDVAIPNFFMKHILLNSALLTPSHNFDICEDVSDTEYDSACDSESDDEDESQEYSEGEDSCDSENGDI